jgi:hypothetical protein
MKVYYKLADPHGFDFHTHKTVNYAENIGKTITVPKYKKGSKPNLCSDTVLHACEDANNCFISAGFPCRVFKVTGRPVVSDGSKSGFRKLRILEEIPQETLDEFFGWRYSEVCNPIHPLKLQAPQIADMQILALQNWASVRASVRASVGDSVWDSVWASVWASVGDSVGASVGVSVWDSVGASVRDSVWASVGDSVRASVGDSVGASVRAYIGSLFPNIKTWKYAPTNTKGYPYQPCVDLWRQGIVPSFDGKTWRLHTGLDAKIAFEITAQKLQEWKP